MQTGGDSKRWGESPALFAVVSTRACHERRMFRHDALFEFCILHFELSMPLQIRHRLSLVVRMRVRARRVPGFLAELRDERIALVNELLSRTPAVLRSNRVLAEQRKRDRRITVRN